MKPWIAVGLGAALLGWSAAGGTAWYELRRARPEDPRLEEARSEAALLRDRVETLAQDSVALAGAVEHGFGGLAAALEERAGVQDRDARELAARVEALERELQNLARALADHAAVAAAAVPLSAPVEPAAVAAQPEQPPEPLAAEPQPAGRRSFLAFALPEREQGFAGARTYEILGDLSRVGFDARSTLHDFSGVSDRVRGALRVDLARPADGIEGRIEIDAASLSTANEGRDEAMLERLEGIRFPAIAFTPTGFAASGVDEVARRVEGRVRGRMSIHGVERELEMTVRASLDEARRLVIEGEAPLKLSDFGIAAPSQLGLISMEDGVRVWIHLRARARLGEAR